MEISDLVAQALVQGFGRPEKSEVSHDEYVSVKAESHLAY